MATHYLCVGCQKKLKDLASVQGAATYTTVVFPQAGDAYRNYGQYHAANRAVRVYRTLCGVSMGGEDFHCFADEPHKITCGNCRKALAQREEANHG